MEKAMDGSSAGQGRERRTFALVSTFQREEDHGFRASMRLLWMLRGKARQRGTARVEYLARWVAGDGMGGDGETVDERFLMVYGASREDALEWGRLCHQDTVVFHDGERCREICSWNGFRAGERVYRVGETVQEFGGGGEGDGEVVREVFLKRKGGAASRTGRGGGAFRLSEAYLVEPPRPSYFQTHETYRQVFKENGDGRSRLIPDWARRMKAYEEERRAERELGGAAQ